MDLGLGKMTDQGFVGRTTFTEDEMRRAIMSDDMAQEKRNPIEPTVSKANMTPPLAIFEDSMGRF
jgi:hypothetical protein